ncbi:MAG TPA: diaminopimelate epimerase [Mycobacteriales bacterium]|nr:diaminopimelate epimerase [Mycobacteriales bacterium]
MTPESIPFVKGHGTRNDFVVLPDLDDALRLGDDDVRAICDRRSGIGADGILRVLRRDGDAPWFMDYRNADGSIAEMCGNGIRVFGRYLVDSGLAEAGRVLVDTRDGVKKLDVPVTGDVTVGMGAPERLTDAKVRIGGGWHAGAGWSMGNPHLVVVDADVAGADLSEVPAVDPPEAFPNGVNVEIVEVVGDSHIRMRVHERGVGETQSCGTGACAAAVAVMAVRGERATYDVDVPGGRLQVKWCDGGQVLLTGPAVLVASGEYRRDSR